MQPQEPGAAGEPEDEGAGAGPELAPPQGSPVGDIAVPGPPRAEGAPQAAQAGRPAAIPLTRASAVWAAMAAGMVLLVVVLVFILENLQEVKVSFFTVHWRIPLGVDLLLAAVLGGLVVFSAGAVRLFQLRRHARRRDKGILKRS